MNADRHCRECGGTLGPPVLDLGKLPLANSLLDTKG